LPSLSFFDRFFLFLRKYDVQLPQTIQFGLIWFIFMLL
jgi:hypothetical protein